VRRTLSIAILIALPDLADACAVCGAAVDRNKSAFVGTTILLSLLPLAMIGAGLWWIGRRGNLAQEFTEREIRVDAPGRPAGGGER